MLSAVISMAPVATFGGQASGWNQFYVMRRFIGPLSSALSELITLGGTHLMLCPPLDKGILTEEEFQTAKDKLLAEYFK